MGRKIENLIGQKFNSLTVIEYFGGSKWICKCDCGNITKPVRGQALKSGATKTCGCSRKKEIEDLTGQIFGRLTVIKYYGINKNRSHCWLCKCECGNERVATHSNLKKGFTQSCGCLRKEAMSDKMKKQLNNWWQDEEYREKQNEMKKEMWQDEEYREKMIKKGEEHPCYNQSLTEEDRQDRRLQEGYNNWKQEVKKQANYTCDCCGQVGGKLCSHHLNDYKHFSNERLELNNGVCLCEFCHKEFHQWMGGNKIKCTKEDYIKFKESRVKENE